MANTRMGSEAHWTASVRHVGTPGGGEKKPRRVGIPLDELDGMAQELREVQEAFTQQPEFEERPKSPPAPFQD